MSISIDSSTKFCCFSWRHARCSSVSRAKTLCFKSKFAASSLETYSGWYRGVVTDDGISVIPSSVSDSIGLVVSGVELHVLACGSDSFGTFTPGRTNMKSLDSPRAVDSLALAQPPDSTSSNLLKTASRGSRGVCSGHNSSVTAGVLGRLGKAQRRLMRPA